MYNVRRRRNKYVSLKGVKHIGVVVDNDDPLRQERVKLRIPGVHDEVSDKDLAWSTPVRTGHANQQNTGSIGHIPPIGTSLLVGFDDETMYFPRHYGPPTTNTQKPHELYGGDQNGKDYPHVESWIDDAGNRHTYNRKRNTMSVEHASGTYFSIDGHGNVGVKVANKQVGANAQLNNTPGVTVESQGKVSVNAAQELVMGSSICKLVSSGDMHILAGGNLYIGAKGTIFAKKPVLANPQVPAVNAPAQPSPRDVPQLSPPSDPTAGSSTGASQ